MKYDNSLQIRHHGIKGMHWGVRRYQNKDGSLTQAGRKRYGDNLDPAAGRGKKTLQKQYGRLEDAVSYKKKASEKDLYKTYGSLEDALSYSKHANKKAKAFIEKALEDIDRQLERGDKRSSYSLSRVNNYINKALSEIEANLDDR